MKLSKFATTRRWVLMGALGVLTAVPALSDWTAAQAQPGQWQNRGRHNDRDQIFTGVVTRDLGGDHFQIRTSWNQVLNVDLVGPTREPRRLSVGDRVEVRGDRNGNKIRANGVRILENRGPGYPGTGYPNRTLVGRVTRDLRGNAFSLLADNGRRYDVVLRNNEPRRLSAGDRVQVQGEMEREIFYAQTIRVLNDRDNYGDHGNHQTANFTGRVTDVRSRTVITVRADNGRAYEVHSREILPRRLDDGSRVRIIGQIRGNVVWVNQVVLS